MRDKFKRIAAKLLGWLDPPPVRMTWEEWTAICKVLSDYADSDEAWPDDTSEIKFRRMLDKLFSQLTGEEML